MDVESSKRAARRSLMPLACGLTVCIPVLVWLISTGDPTAYLRRQVPPGQVLFVLSKLCALLALVMFWLQCMTALARFSPALKGFVQLSRRQHVLLGSATFAAIITHVVLFIAASSLRTQHMSVGQLLPSFDQGFYVARISVGAIAFWLMCAVVFAGWLRSRGAPAWRWLHRASFVVFGLSFFHGIGIGSETRFGLMKYIYVFIGLSLAAAAGSWIVMMLKHRLSQRQRAQPQEAFAVTNKLPGTGE